MSSQDPTQPKVKYGESVKISTIQADFMKQIEKRNIERVTKLQRVRRNNLITAGILGVSVISIYAYAILSVQQEKFLDDFEEPKKVKT